MKFSFWEYGTRNLKFRILNCLDLLDPGVFINYLCTFDLYGPVRKVFDAGR